MPDLYTQGPVNLFPWLTFLPKTQYGVALQWFMNRAVLQSILPSLPCAGYKFTMVGFTFRPRVTPVNAAATSSATTIGVVDASIFMNGDVLKVSSTGEVLEIVATPDIINNVLTVRRGVGVLNGSVTDGVSQPAAIVGDGTASVFNLGNSRTGGEKYQAAISQIPKGRSQNIQTFQHVVSVAGITQALGASLPEPAAASPFSANQSMALQALMDDVEVSSLIGVGEELGTGSPAVQRPKQHGLLNILQTTNLGPNGTAAGYSGAPSTLTNYMPTNLEQDLFEPIRANGGQPGLLMISSKFRTGLTRWGAGLQLLNAGQTQFGVPINVYYSPLLPPIPIVENFWLDRINDNTPLANTATAICLTREQANFRVLEALDYKPYGRAGDTGAAGEGDYIHRAAIQVNNEQMHGAVRGIQSFAKQA